MGNWEGWQLANKQIKIKDKFLERFFVVIRKKYPFSLFNDQNQHTAMMGSYFLYEKLPHLGIEFNSSTLPMPSWKYKNKMYFL